MWYRYHIRVPDGKERRVRYTIATEQLSDEALATLLQAALSEARRIGVPQCIVVVDASAVDLVSFRMVGAKVLSMRSARAKAQTAASTGQPSATLPEAVRGAVAAATEGAMTGLPGGLPIRLNGRVVGGIGIGSGTGEQDVAVARAALAAIGAEVPD